MNQGNELTESQLLENTLKELEFYSVLDFISKRSQTELGKEIILALKPEENINATNDDLDAIEEMVDLIAYDDDLPLYGLSDIRNKLHKSLIQNAVLSTTEVLSVKDTIAVARLVKHYLLARQEKYVKLFQRSKNLHENRLLEKHIDDAIDDSGEVRDNASRELSSIRKSIHDKSNHLRHRLQKILERVVEEDMVQEEFVTLREGRFVLPIKSEHKRHIPGIIHGMSQTGSTVFLEPSEIFEMNNDLSVLLNEEKREIYKILANLTDEIREDAPAFLSSIEILAGIDSIIARARYASEFGGIKPRINTENRIWLNNVKHPLLAHRQGLKSVIPLSIEFDQTKRGHLISGPNAGGQVKPLL